ncbi:chemotaxis protein CheD [Desulfolutivibrio sulfoxidireducens]|uniref:chemotaxis protein CheD n=1 Tax=Desulfolutivibrio sulfoxidireducens TaxID=2773299 RepID=UPI00159E4F91|nr:chemotaxis protein CheD [Desulfolutivibrio sulfoxidireducens]QLA16405.1 chemotaxis protein CheD [Desulfolutivibrio sulfoxidireducens]QLA19714.1 chemotaxis protein CheD [Desulfolutivibrio sulfoxidireducens]
MEIIVGISDMRIGNRKNQILVTHSLGSCLGLAVYDHEAGVGGLIHCLLPMARESRKSHETNPCMYVNTGVPHMIKSMYAKGARKERLVIKAAGCGRMMNISNVFDTGAANLTALAKLLGLNDLRLSGSDTGGSIPRTVRLHLETGRVVVSSCGKSWDI